MIKKIIPFLLLIICSTLIICGCEESKGNEGLIISPSSYDMTGVDSDKLFAVVGKNDAADITSDSSSDSTSTTTSTNSTVTTSTTITDNMRLSDLSYPLEWSVGNSSIGTIIQSSGDSALYRKTGSGTQTIIARDQFDNEGYATVYQ